ncbi:hypothetical protein K493DRAFT_314473 [Basidiobolus meristosporus CBS 931.73]|uniref:Uncharacterized protein n=1 Tax=Basidiobolus meristosporus CBS 931.73 TaxID=1314790 RepID=A0A1Y1YEZ9_9FUNG|nr:hypothetical protein K493DRAFT_314473 [Basidiobolus meristosporus CBS 931.73]|eukprot:ORX96528.1 hypothetical protein K493DRAFT_314473 [Basidiobolus meristosporus CBS 931.73]
MSARSRHSSRHEDIQSVHCDANSVTKAPDINDAILTFQLLEALREGKERLFTAEIRF